MSLREFGDLIEGWSAPPRPDGLVLDGTYVRLEPLSADQHSDDLFYANVQSDVIWDYLPYGPFKTKDAYRDWVVQYQNKADPFFYAVIEKTSGKTLGVMSYLRVSPEAGSIEVGHINWSKELQRTRAATEALYLMMGWAFEAGYRRFEWKCDGLNMGSRRAAQRFGFSYEGLFRQAGLSKGRNRDTAWFACIDKEWPDLKRAYETWLEPKNFDAGGMQKTSLAELTRAILVNEDPRLSSEG